MHALVMASGLTTGIAAKMFFINRAKKSYLVGIVPTTSSEDSQNSRMTERTTRPTTHTEGSNPLRCAIYARVSLERGQDTDNQLIALRDYAARQQWVVAHVYEDHITGKTVDRESFRRMFEDVSRRSFDVVLV
jgi:predicted site-specific integrase-resolvase